MEENKSQQEIPNFTKTDEFVSIPLKLAQNIANYLGNYPYSKVFDILDAIRNAEGNEDGIKLRKEVAQKIVNNLMQEPVVAMLSQMQNVLS